MTSWGNRLRRVGRKKLILGFVISGFLLLTMPLSHLHSVSTPLPISLADSTPSPVKVIPTVNNSTKTLSATISKPQPVTGLPSIHEGLSSSTVPELQKLAQYETNAGGAVASGVMLFTDYPDDVGSAKLAAKNMASRLTQISRFGITPVIVMEPTNSSGTLNFASYSTGAYDSILSEYFQTLKSTGISDHDMGVWVYFPEANLPEWGPVDVGHFGPNVARTVNLQKSFFPNSLASILLDTASYPAGSTSWGAGKYVSFSPFLSNIPKGLIDYFGLQGFPWAPPANQPGIATSYNPAVYLNPNLAIEAAGILATNNIWFNTGTFSAMYTNNPAQTVQLSPGQRQTMLSGVLAQAMIVKGKGYNITVNLFCEDKSNTSLAVDRSYKTPEDQSVFNSFAGELSVNHIPMWLFDH